MKLYIYILCFFFSILYSQSEFKNVQVLDITSKSELRNYMKSITKDLGVKCSHCHNMDDKSLDTPHKEIAREMILLTRQINDYLHAFQANDEEGKEEALTVTCWTCHKGKTEVEQKRPIEE